MDWRGRIKVDAKVLVGKLVIRGARVSVEQVLEQHNHLTPEDVSACVSYASVID
jgi:uncharacterized protein (DUF433 family)